MPLTPSKITFSGKKVLILGSGGLRIGQAGEFDYSGSQAIKALKEEGIYTILVNPNIATVQTDPGLADQVYLQPLTVDVITRILEKERPDGILFGFGGQTALNLGLALEAQGILARYQVQVLGTSINTIRITEDRELFKNALLAIDVKTAKSYTVTSVEQAVEAAKMLGYPIMMRSGFSLGGLGSGKILDEKHLIRQATEVLHAAPQILIEEYLGGWKEVEYEVVRDRDDNTITVCNMENFDPMGIHTGESIVIAPSQTLSNAEYHSLREIAIKTIRHLEIVGECNIQYALNPENGDYRVIEINARLSRSSALASKATGYPLAFVAAKLALGLRLHEIQNAVTRSTTAFFEPALDYVVVKFPRWDIQKLRAAHRTIGSEMKSVGEVMAIGRSFPEALQKAVRMLNLGNCGLSDYPQEIQDLEEEIRHPTDRRLFALYRYLLMGGTVEKAHEMSCIDRWFLHHLNLMASMELVIQTAPTLDSTLMQEAKRLGFSDKHLANLRDSTEQLIRKTRKSFGILPYVKQIDTLAGEFNAQTNYLYTTYHGDCHDVDPSPQPPILVLGSGPYCIGSSVEFDWCAVNTARTLRKMGYYTLLINSNPETVSTDYDESDRLYFEELTLERISDLADFEATRGIIVSVGGQIANNLAMPLHHAGYTLLGTPALSIDQAENRKKFSQLLGELGIDQPAWKEVDTLASAKAFANEVGYPLLVRPSYVLSGAAMNVIGNHEELDSFLKEAALVSREHPVVLSQFILNAKELEMDGVAQNGDIVIEAISEHVENAGVHSGDATIVLPPQRLYLETIRQAKKITEKIVAALQITGPFNLQFIAKDNTLKVIECNVRASRSFPFVSKVTNHNFIDISTRVIMGETVNGHYETLELDHVGVKSPQFSYNRLKGASPVAHVEMASTGEVACLGDNLLEAFHTSWLATEQSLKGKKILVSLVEGQRERLLEELHALDAQGWEIFSTEGTHDYLSRQGIASRFVYKVSEKLSPNVAELLTCRGVDLIVNLPRGTGLKLHTDGFVLRRLAIDHHIPLVTNLQFASLFLKSLTQTVPKAFAVRSWSEYLAGKGGLSHFQ